MSLVKLAPVCNCSKKTDSVYQSFINIMTESDYKRERETIIENGGSANILSSINFLCYVILKLEVLTMIGICQPMLFPVTLPRELSSLVNAERARSSF